MPNLSRNNNAGHAEDKHIMQDVIQVSRRQVELSQPQVVDVGDSPEEDEDDGCAALLALQSAVFEIHSKPGKRGKAGEVDQAGATGKPRRAASSSDTGGGNGSASSGGSAKDVLFDRGGCEGQGLQLSQPGADESMGTDPLEGELEDMEVDIVSETEKGCQAWFPPLPGEYERRRMHRHAGGRSQLERQLSIVGGSGGRRASKRKLSSAAPQGDDAPIPSAQFDGACWGDMMNVFGDPSLGNSLGLLGVSFPGLIDAAPTASVGSGKWKRGGGGGGAGSSRNLDFGGYGMDEEAAMDDGFLGRVSKGGGSGAASPMGTDLQHEGTGNKRRLIWSQELHDRFLAAIKKLGVKNAVPKAILTLMDVEVSHNVGRITRTNVHSTFTEQMKEMFCLTCCSSIGHDEGERCKPSPEVPHAPEDDGCRKQHDARGDDAAACQRRARIRGGRSSLERERERGPRRGRRASALAVRRLRLSRALGNLGSLIHLEWWRCFCPHGAFEGSNGAAAMGCIE